MTASTSEISIKNRDTGTVSTRAGVLYAEQVTTEDGTPGVVVQYADQSRHYNGVEFIRGHDLVAVYDELADEPAHEEYKTILNDSPR